MHLLNIIIWFFLFLCSALWVLNIYTLKMCLLFAHQIAWEKDLCKGPYLWRKHTSFIFFNIMNNYIFITAAGITMSLSEGLYKWMLFPDVQRLMDITVHCSGKL